MRDTKYLRQQKKMLCVCTYSQQNLESHHLLRCSSRIGMSGKSSDHHTIPLRSDIHRALHDSGDEVNFLKKYNITNAEKLAEDLYKNKNNLKKCRRIIYGLS